MSDLNIGLTVDLPEVEHQLKRIADKLSTPEWSFEGGSLNLSGLKLFKFTQSLGGNVMFRVPADHPDIPYSVENPRVVNSEGGTVPGWTVTNEVTSDNDAAIMVDAANSVVKVGAANQDGSPSQATVTVVFTATHPTDPDSPRVNQIAEVFIVEAGDEVGFAGGGITFTGLNPEPTA